MYRTALAVPAGLLALALLVSFTAPAPAQPAATQATEKKEPVKPGEKVPDFTLTDIHGKSWNLHETLAASKAKAVVIKIVSSKCPVSLAYDERTRQAYADWVDKGVLFLAICPNNTQTETAKDLHVWQVKNMMAMPVLLDQDQKVADQLGATHTPTYYVLDAEGTLKYHGAFDNNKKPGEEGREAPLADAVAAVLEGKAVAKDHLKAFGCNVKR